MMALEYDVPIAVDDSTTRQLVSLTMIKQQVGRNKKG